MINEEISTIFVVGFPDDMQEREFQNMFIFSPGFEAATLKIPPKDSSDGDEGSGSNPRKQIIGFAKFRTRTDALEARDVLSGRKVDAEKGSVLKAEMAKKNLHTKRGLSNDQNNQNYPLMQMAKRYPAPASINTASSTYDAFHSIPFAPQLPSDLLSPQDYGYDFYSDSVYTPTTPTTPPVYEQPFSARGSFDASNGVIGGLVGAPRAALVNGVRYNNKGFLDGDDLNYLSKSTPVDILTKNKVASSGFSANPLLMNDDLSHRVAQLALNGSAPGPSTGMVSGSPSVATPPGFRPPNPADQNPPCNTLYVGNLPMNTSEEELKQLFSKCPGYKRMCFRTKQNGPMCFVEFEDVNYATQAMTELYGNPLSNSVKGGIRLSFSKNPLGVRSSNNSSTNGDRRDSIQSVHSLERRDSAYSLLSERRDSAYSLDRRDSAFSLALERRDSFQLERRDSVTTTGSSGGGSGPAAAIAERFEFERRGSASSFLLPPEKREPYFSSDRRDSLPFDPLV